MLGALPGISFEEENTPINQGDLLVLYSDGITEAENEVEEEFGESRLIKVISEHLDKPASVLIETIVEAVKSFAGETPQSDDITLVAIKRM